MHDRCVCPIPCTNKRQAKEAQGKKKANIPPVTAQRAANKRQKIITHPVRPPGPRLGNGRQRVTGPLRNTSQKPASTCRALADEKGELFGQTRNQGSERVWLLGERAQSSSCPRRLSPARKHSSGELGKALGFSVQNPSLRLKFSHGP